MQQYDYDEETDILTIKLLENKLNFGKQRENIITHYDKENKPVEIEVLEASKTVLRILETIVSRKRTIEAA
ncbi:MAG: DUF2283 domain-containing protein [Nitrososphaerales archaeon]